MSGDENDPSETEPNETGSGFGFEREFKNRFAGKSQTVGERGWLASDADRPERPALVEQGGNTWLEKGRAGLICAPGGHGKSTAMIQLGVSIAAGCDTWLDAFDVCRDGKVLMLLGEHDEHDAREDIVQTVEHMGLNERQQKHLNDNLHAVDLYGEDVQLVEERPSDFELDKTRLRYSGEGKIDIDENGDNFVEDMLQRYERGVTEKAKFFEKILKGDPFELVIIDPLRRFASADTELDSENATRFVQLLERWTDIKAHNEGFGPTVLATHHTGKLSDLNENSDFYNKVRDQNFPRGSSGLADGVRWMANLIRGAVDGSDYHGADDIQDVALLSISKSNRTEKGKTVRLEAKRNGMFSEASYEIRQRNIQQPHDIEQKTNEQGSNQNNPNDPWES